ncbi:hypothetical protein D3C76_662720 [compost metagenome]
MHKWKSRVYWIVIILLFSSVALNFWNSFQKQKLNQRYERMIEQREEMNRELTVLLKQVRNHVDRY